MIKRFFYLLIFISAYSSAADQGVLDTVRAALHQPGGKLMSIHIIHRQYNREWLEEASLEIIAPGQYFMELAEQSIKVDGDDIYTWNKSGNQVIIDQTNPNDVSVLDLLTGDFDLVRVVSVKNFTYGRTIEFDISAAGISGSMRIGRHNTPQELEFSYSEDDNILVKINSIVPIGAESMFSKFNISGKDIIDLRE